MSNAKSVLTNYIISKYRKLQLFLYNILHTTFHFQIETTIYNREFQVIRDLPLIPELENDTENIIQLCIETIEGGHSVLIFCPTKNWCEKLSLQTASAFLSIGLTFI